MGPAQVQAWLRDALGDPGAGLREGQWEAIDALVHGRGRLLVVERTGWGKSAVYFLATRLLRNSGAGPALVVSPLLALMRNQMAAASRFGLRAASMNSSNVPQWSRVRAALRAGEVDLLFVSPERLSRMEVLKDALRVAENAGLLVIDEAHCVSEWGHDFRPDYGRLARWLRRMSPRTPVLATTATAPDRVVRDIRRQLGGIDLRRGPLARESIVLRNLRIPDPIDRTAWLARELPALPGTGVVYTLNVADAERLTDRLRRCGIDARAYHGRLPRDAVPNRSGLESALLDNRLKVLVATPALGMGFDKPDLGFVVHYQAPASLLAYYQQVGRAGRRLERAYGILLAGAEDEAIHRQLRRRVARAGASQAGADARVPAAPGAGERGRRWRSLVRRWLVPAVASRRGAGRSSPAVPQSGSHPASPPGWAEVQAYIDARDCLMARLCRAVGDPTPTPCGICAVCDPR